MERIRADGDDVIAAVTSRTLSVVDARRIALMGYSLAGMVTLLQAATGPSSESAGLSLEYSAVSNAVEMPRVQHADPPTTLGCGA